MNFEDHVTPVFQFLSLKKKYKWEDKKANWVWLLKMYFFFKTNVVILQLKKVVGYDIKNVFFWVIFSYIFVYWVSVG